MALEHTEKYFEMKIITAWLIFTHSNQYDSYVILLQGCKTSDI